MGKHRGNDYRTMIILLILGLAAIAFLAGSVVVSFMNK